MKKKLIIIGVVFLSWACHDKSDHNIKAPFIDSFVERNGKPAKDTSIHTGTIPGVVQLMKTDLGLIPRVIGADEAFAQLMIIHRKALLEMSQIELSEGGRKDMYEEAEKVKSRSYKLLAGFKTYLSKRHLPGRNLNTLCYSIPFTEEIMQRMVHSGPDANKEFAVMMIAVEKSEAMLARSYLKEGKNKGLRLLASQIITTNQQEIERVAQY